MRTALVLCTLLMLGVLGGAAASEVQIYGKSLYAGHILGSGHDGRQAGRGQMHQARTITKNAIHRSLDLESFNLHVAPTASRINLPTIIRLYPPTAKPLHLHANMPLRFGRDSSRDHPSNPNMPLRFGRDSDSAHDRSSNPNMPLRFGRDSDSAHDRSSNPNMPLRFGRHSDSAHERSSNPNMPLRFGRDSDSAHKRSSNPNMPLRFGRESDDSGNNPNMPQRFGRSWKTFRMCPQCSDKGKQLQSMERDGLYWSLLRTLQSY